MGKKHASIIGILAFVLGTSGYLIAANTNEGQSVSQVQSTTTTSEISAITTITAEELARHGTLHDCWMAYEGVVYDVTDYISSHPGGQKIVQGCGLEIGDLFQGAGISGHLHSKKAGSILKNLPEVNLLK